MRIVILMLFAIVLVTPVGAGPAKRASVAERRHQLVEDYFGYRSAAHALAALEWARQALPRSPAGRDREELLSIVRDEWGVFAGVGLGERILASGQQLSAEELQALLTEKGEKAKFDDARTNWILALVDAGRRDEAGALIEALGLPHGDKRIPSGAKENVFAGAVFATEGADNAEFLRDLVAARSTDDVFDRYIGDGQQGLLWSAGDESTLSLRLAARYLSANGYPGPAKEMEADACNRFSSQQLGYEEQKVAARQPAEFQRLVARASAMLEESHWMAGCKTEERGQVGTRLQAHEEKRVPKRPKSAAVTKLDDKQVVGPANFEFVRGERAAQNVTAVWRSAAVDPAGELGALGYWMTRSTDGGNTWGNPIYLGLQQFEPYVIPSSSKLPLLNGDTLQLEVEVQHLDPKSITFPPVMLALQRQARGLYIELPLAALEKDSDGDGFTDVLEEKLHTDAHNADTDGDGVSDGDDDFPQVSARLPASSTAPIVQDLLKRLAGYEAAGIVEPPRTSGDLKGYFSPPHRRVRTSSGPLDFLLLEADAAQLAGVHVTGQVIVLNDAQVADLNERFGPCYPLGLPGIWMNHAGNRAVVRWSAGWTGGTLLYTLEDGKWEAKEIAHWIS